MLPNPMSPEECVRFSREHLAYEIEMFCKLAETMGPFGISPGPPDPGKTDRLARLESFGIHTRVLVDFLRLPPTAQPTDVWAGNFFENYTLWQPDDLSDILTLHCRRAGRDIAHLSRNRLYGEPDEKRWPLKAIERDVLVLLNRFVTEAPSSRLHSSVKDLVEQHMSDRWHYLEHYLRPLKPHDHR